jgi:glutathione S-transferase
MTDIEIIGAPQSIFVRTVRMACVEKGVAYRFIPARPHSPEVDSIHPYGKIPVMRYGDFELCESKAIATFVDRVFPGPKLFPDDAKLCGKIEQWTSIVNTTILPGILPYFMAYFFSGKPDGSPDRETIERVLPDVKKHMEVLDKAVAATGCLAGTNFTYADMSILPSLAYLRDLPESGALMDGAKELTQYFDKHSRRESFKATVPPPMSEVRASAPG